ncbi:MAG TPA: hypothetical protein DEA08_18265 [Planctomycetes bacterium]|nr:hypothetical protein [Planctomycetota bacterium]
MACDSLIRSAQEANTVSLSAQRRFIPSRRARSIPSCTIRLPAFWPWRVRRARRCHAWGNLRSSWTQASLAALKAASRVGASAWAQVSRSSLSIAHTIVVIPCKVFSSPRSPPPRAS